MKDSKIIDMKVIKTCTVLRPAGGRDFSANGITARFDHLDVIVGVPYLMMTGFYGGEYYDKPDEKAVEMFVKENGLDPKRVLVYCDKVNNPVYTPYLKPLDSVYRHRTDPATGLDLKLLDPIAGGNYVVFKDDNRERVVRVHDRYETQEECDTLSV